MLILIKFGCLLHVRGSVSLRKAGLNPILSSSPRTWRCFYIEKAKKHGWIVFSTYVEVFLTCARRFRFRSCLLHVRGGVSQGGVWAYIGQTSSPRPWRCFRVVQRVGPKSYVFSTSVEVFPTVTRTRARLSRLLHVRGGVSFSARCHTSSSVSSPRPWRCFLAGVCPFG